MRLCNFLVFIGILDTHWVIKRPRVVYACIAPYLIARMRTIDVTLTLVISACMHRTLDMQLIIVYEYTTYHKHNDVTTWKCFPNYWSVVRGICRFPLDYLPKGPAIRACIACLNKLLNKQSLISLVIALMWRYFNISPHNNFHQENKHSRLEILFSISHQVIVFQLDHNFRNMCCHYKNTTW